MGDGACSCQQTCCVTLRESLLLSEPVCSFAPRGLELTGREPHQLRHVQEEVMCVLRHWGGMGHLCLGEGKLEGGGVTSQAGPEGWGAGARRKGEVCTKAERRESRRALFKNRNKNKTHH